MIERGLDTRYSPNAVENTRTHNRGEAGEAPELARLLAEQLQRKDERIAMLEAMLEHAASAPMQHERRPGAFAFAPPEAADGQAEEAARSSSLRIGAQAYDAPLSLVSPVPVGGAAVYSKMEGDGADRNDRKGAQAYDLPTRALNADAPSARSPRIKIADMGLEASPIAQAVMQAAQADAPEITAPQFEPTVRMPAADAMRRKQMLLHGAEQVRHARLRALTAGMAALLALVGTLGLLHAHSSPQAQPAGLTAAASGTPAVVKRAAAPQTGAAKTVAAAAPAATAAVPAVAKAARVKTAFHPTARSVSRVEKAPHRAAVVSPVIEPETSRPIARQSASPAPHPVVHRTDGPPAPGPEILPEQATEAAEASQTAEAPMPRIHRRRHRRHVVVATANPQDEQGERRTRDRASEVEEEFARHPEPGYDEKSDRWLDNLPDR